MSARWLYTAATMAFFQNLLIAIHAWQNGNGGLFAVSLTGMAATTALAAEQKKRLSMNTPDQHLPRHLRGFWQHLKTGGIYEVVCEGEIEADLTPAIVYRSLSDGRTWVRPAGEFLDGRFEKIVAEPQRG